MTRLQELSAEIAAKQKALHELWEAHPDLDFTEEQVASIREQNEELTDLGKKYDELRAVDETFQANLKAMQDQRRVVNGLETPIGESRERKRERELRTLGDMFIAAEGYKNWPRRREARIELPDVDLKTLMETGAGFEPEALRTGRVVEYAVRRPMVQDLLPTTTTTQSAIKYMEETTHTNAAAAVAEGGTKPESALAFTQRTDPVEKIATWLPVTDEQLEDVPQARNLVNNRLSLMVMLEEEDEILTGDGSTPNIDGFLNKTGVQVQAKGTDPVPDAIYKGMTKVRHTGFAEPSGVVMHPNDWQDVRLLRTTDGIYIWGSPAEAGPERIWGKPVVVTTAMTENTALTGDFVLFAELFRKMGITIKTTDSHSDYFVKNIQAILAETRIALAIYRAAAFAKITGI